MQNLIIIGNGFDLAHGLKTTYSDFFADLNSKVRDTPNEYLDLVYTKKDSDKKVRLDEGQNYDLGRSNFKNRIIHLISKKGKTASFWSDLEYFYFQILLNYNDIDFFKKEFSAQFGFSSAKELNNDFEQLKNYLERYLTFEEKKLKKNRVYQQFFDAFNKTNSTVVNFNYTNTVKQYLENLKNINLVQMHGELNNQENPIIFGFAANDNESKQLLDRDDNDLLHNIKKINYKLTDNDLRLKQLMDDSQSIDVFIMGHSCGISDKLILNQILNHKKIKSIRIFYYKEYNGYRDSAINLDRIIDDYSKKEEEARTYHKLLNFPQCFSMPQFNWNDEEINKFLKYIYEVLEKQRRDFEIRNSATIGIF